MSAGERLLAHLTRSAPRDRQSKSPAEVTRTSGCSFSPAMDLGTSEDPDTSNVSHVEDSDSHLEPEPEPAPGLRGVPVRCMCHSAIRIFDS